MPINDDVPREFDKIQVLYVVKAGERVWWPATVLSSQEHDVAGTVKGFATIEFAAYRNTARCVEDVYFLSGRTVSTNNGDTSWGTSAEAADAGDGDGGEAGWRESRARCARKRALCPPPQSDERSDDEDSATTSAVTTSASALQRTQKKRKKFPLGLETAHEARAERNNRQTARQTTGAPVDNLAHRLTLIEARLDGMQRRSPDDVEFVESTRDIWKTRVLKILSKPMPKFKGTREKDFSNAISPFTVTFKEDFAYSLFTRIVNDIARTSALAEDVTFLPSLTCLQDPQMDIASGKILFRSARAVLHWLGVTSQKDVRRLLCRRQTQREGTDVVRVLGGLQSGETAEDPVRLYVGKSCVADCRATCAGEGEEVTVVEFGSGKWDDSNNTLLATPTVQRRKHGDYSRPRNCDTVFALSWVWTGGYDGRAVGAHSKKTGSTRIGIVTLNMPSVMLCGNVLCEDVGKLLTETYVRPRVV